MDQLDRVVPLGPLEGVDLQVQQVHKVSLGRLVEEILAQQDHWDSLEQPDHRETPGWAQPGPPGMLVQQVLLAAQAGRDIRDILVGRDPMGTRVPPVGDILGPLGPSVPRACQAAPGRLG